MQSGQPVADLGGALSALLLRISLFLLVIGLLIFAFALLRQRNGGDLPRWFVNWWGAERAPAGPLRMIRIGLGSLWIVAGLLQAQPRMPAGFIGQVILPGQASAPAWLSNLLQPATQVWTAHPVGADAATVFVQIGLGLLILLGGRGGRADRVALWVSVAWAAVVWIFGEAFGGLLNPGASWLMGSPGAVLVYVVAALVLIRGRQHPPETVARWCRRCVAGWFVIGAVLQAVPWEQNWTAEGLAAPFRRSVQVAQPSFMLDPIRSSLSLVAQHPIAVNATLVGLLALLAVGLCSRRPRLFVGLALALSLGTWWLAQDFGVLGGYGTDPNTALPLALLLVAGWPPPRPATAIVAAPTSVPDGGPAAAPRRFTAPPRFTAPTRAAAYVMAVGAAVGAPLSLCVLLLGPADATAVTADSGGGIVTLAHRAAPDFSLTDQHNAMTSMRDSRGKITIVTFLDPVCSDDCPMIANQIASAVRSLGPAAQQVQIIAVDSNPLFYHVSDVAAFTTSHGLDDLRGWHFVAGSEPDLRSVMAAYGVSVDVPAVGMISHSEGLYFIDRSGAQVAFLGDGANARLATPYARTIADELKKLIG
jgi:cytochrome oxidase Cu insertion factor (SCO1/SenC/PrrC family)